MKPSFAVSFEYRLRRDKMLFLIKLELLTIFAAGMLASLITNQHIILTAILATLAATCFAAVVKAHFEKEGRKLRRAVVRSVKYWGPDWFFFLPMVPSFSVSPAGYVVEAVSEDFRLIRFMDWRPWKIGQQLLVLSDVRGKVLAVRDMKNPVRLELLKRLA